MNFLQRWQQNAARRAGRRQDRSEERGQVQQWFLLAGGWQPSGDALPNPAALTPLYPPASTFWADPFVWSQDGQRWIFFEDYPYATRKGRISAIPVDATGQPVSEVVVALEEHCHLSYPFLFEHDGQLYMMPEKSAECRVDVYRCVRFPDRWERAHTLIEGIKIADATLFPHEGRWWLFTAAKQGSARINESLFAFYADHPLSSRWTPHPANPLVRDFSRGRQGGRIQPLADGSLLRPSQDCVRRYGHGLWLNRVDLLTPERFAETPLQHLGSESYGWRGLHHCDWRDGLLVMDAQRLLPDTEVIR